MASLPVPDTAAGQEGLSAVLTAPRDALLALDFDGTLAPIVADPARAVAHPDVVPALARLARQVGTVAIVTGRSAETAVGLAGLDRTPGLDRLTVLGAYGAERWDGATGALHLPEPHPGVPEVRAALPGVLRDTLPPGEADIEDKGGALAVHTRRARDPRGSLDALREPLGRLATAHGLHVEPGRFVLELRPPGSDKGAALETLVREREPAALLYAGDDLGDLPAFATVARLRAERGLPGLTVHSGSEEVHELAEAADLTVDGPQGVAALLSALADLLDG